MAYSKSPVSDTTSVQRVKLTREIAARDGGVSNRDEDILNLVVEPVKNKLTREDRHFLIKRSGTEQVVASVGAGTIRGWYFWEDQSKLIYSVDSSLYVYNVNTGATTSLIGYFTSGSSEVGFCLFQYSTGESKVVATNGTILLTIDSSNTVVVCADPDLPVHLPYPIYIDGYIFVAKVNTGDIYNSNNDDPLAWTSGDFITAELEGDNIIRLAKINNYLLVFGTNSIEYFWDAANATGSPLQRNDTPVKFNTYLGGFAQYGNAIYYVGVSEGGVPDVYVLKDFKIEEVGSPTISRYLNGVTSGISTWKGGIVSFKGHSFYVMNIGGERTYVLDTDNKLWSRWIYQEGNIFDINRSISITTTLNAYTYFCMGSTNNIFRFNDNVYTDSGTEFTCLVTTEADDFDTLNIKTMRRATVIADRPTTDTNILIRWSDNDSETFNTGLLTNLNQDLPCVYRLGSFRQRVFKLTVTSTTDFRIQGLEVEINKGRS